VGDRVGEEPGSVTLCRDATGAPFESEGPWAGKDALEECTQLSWPNRDLAGLRPDQGYIWIGDEQAKHSVEIPRGQLVIERAQDVQNLLLYRVVGLHDPVVYHASSYATTWNSPRSQAHRLPIGILRTTDILSINASAEGRLALANGNG
jgi:hypothetical protein